MAKQWQLAAFMLMATLTSSEFSKAQTLPNPKERPVLTISGQIATTNQGETAQFDRTMLEDLGMVAIRTTTPWHNGVINFEGVRLDKLMSHVGAKGRTVVAIALNDYTTEIPIGDFAKYGTILAIKKDGEYMPVRDKGPLFIIYPFDSRSELKSQIYYGRSAWQVTKLVVK